MTTTTKSSTIVRTLRIPGLPRITGFQVECSCGKEFQVHSSLDNQGYAMHRANAECQAHRSEHYRKGQRTDTICPECGADSLIHVRVPESDVVVEQCNECGWADA